MQKKNASWISYVKTVSRICQHSKETGRGMMTIKIEHTEWRGQEIQIKPV